MSEQRSMRRVLQDQRRIVTVALVLAVAWFWIFVPLGDWEVGTFLAVGTLMGLVNHLATERSLLKVIDSGEELTRSEIASSALVRLLFVAGVAVAIAVAFWPIGFTVLIGLALFRLITLVMTGIPLLKELSKA